LKTNSLSWLAKPLAWCIARIRINRVTHETVDGRSFFRKERTALSWIFIVLGNFVFRFRSVPVCVLHQRQWQQWEQAICKAMDADIPAKTGRGLMLPEIAGKPVCDFAGSKVEPMSGGEIVQRLKLAIGELHRLHQIKIVVDGRSVLFSHGDASVNNVVITDAGKSATWLDFDLRHDLRQPAAARHADDLRAFMETASVCLAAGGHSDEDVRRYSQAVREVYPDPEIWRLWSVARGNFWNSMDVFSCAQRFRAKL
jgi:hypothetical protein